jgi:hypothetical protein
MVSIQWRERAGETQRSTMTHDELIAEARKHATDMPRLSGEPWATLEILPKVTVGDAVVVSFEGDQPHRKMFVVLEKETGKFIAPGFHFRKSCQEH